MQQVVGVSILVSAILRQNIRSILMLQLESGPDYVVMNTLVQSPPTARTNHPLAIPANDQNFTPIRPGAPPVGGWPTFDDPVTPHHLPLNPGLNGAQRQTERTLDPLAGSSLQIPR